MSATRSRHIGVLGVLSAAALAAAFVGLAVGGGGRATSALVASEAGPPASKAPIEQLPGLAAERATELAASSISRTVRIAQSSISSRDTRIEIVVGQRHIHFRNGGRVELADGLQAEFFLDPYPPTSRKLWLDVHLTRASKGTPVASARATMDFDMELMPHGSSKVTAKNVGGGHYVYAVDESMYGAWRHTLRFDVGKRAHEVRMVVVTAPA